jgi:hypothetical protein
MTLLYIYSDSTAVLGPLSTYAEPHTYDLCQFHGEKLTVPQGWKVIEHKPESYVVEPSFDDLMAIADAVREVVRSEAEENSPAPELGRRGHLRVLPNLND